MQFLHHYKYRRQKGIDNKRKHTQIDQSLRDCHSPNTSDTIRTAADAEVEPLTYTSKPTSFASCPVQLEFAGGAALWVEASRVSLPKPESARSQFGQLQWRPSRPKSDNGPENGRPTRHQHNEPPCYNILDMSYYCMPLSLTTRYLENSHGSRLDPELAAQIVSNQQQSGSHQPSTVHACIRLSEVIPQRDSS